jgi:cytochrome b561
MGGALMGSVAYVLLAQNTEDKAVKGRYMFLHKSCGLLAAGLLMPRLFLRATSTAPGPLKASITKVEEIGAKLSHAALYGLMIVLPVTGVSMGYFSGFGLPFFFTTIPGASKEDKRPDISKQAFSIHKLAGQALEYLVPFHVFAALSHAVRGHAIFSRILSISSKK